MSTKRCPACGSDDIQTIKNTRVFHDAFAGNVEASVTVDECLICGVDGDFNRTNDEEIKHALETIKKNGASNIINYLSSNGFNLAAIERALELPQRTLSKWKNETPPTAAGLTLLKFVALFPWLINVADTKFDYEQSQEMCAHAAVSFLCQKTKAASSFQRWLSPETVEIHLTQVGNIQNNFLAQAPSSREIRISTI